MQPGGRSPIASELRKSRIDDQVVVVPLPRTSLVIETPLPNNIALIGYRGTGKSTVGRLLAQEMQYGFIDTDLEIETEARKSIAEIFADQGESGFRDLEAQVINRVAKEANCVLSLGGGAILRPDNCDHIAATSTVVWLTAEVDTIAARIQTDPQSVSQRPSLSTLSARDEIRAVLQSRLSAYQSMADLTVATDRRTPADIVEEILRQLGQHHD